VPEKPKGKPKQKRALPKKPVPPSKPKPKVDQRWSGRAPERRLVDKPLIASVSDARESRWTAPSGFRHGVDGAVIVEARGISKVYRSGPSQIAALNSVDLVLNQGEMVAVMGPSGSGKTTLLNCLSGLDEVTSGEVIVEGVSFARMSDAARTEYRSKRMGFIFQAFNLLPVFSSVENVELPLLLSGVRTSQARQRAREALNSVGLSTRERHRPSELSAGEQQRVAIARAIAPNPAVLWADEPTGNLDSENAERVIQMIKRLNVDRGLTILLVTHDRHMATWAEQLLQMRDGRVIG
jgi:putative ABC transport system ATP-binding protein